MRLPLPRGRSALLTILALGACASGCSGSHSHTTSRDIGTPAVPPHGAALTWLFTEPALSEVFLNGDVQTHFERSRIFEIARFERPPAGSAVVPTVKFASYASMKQTLADGGLRPWVRAVLYDNEAWSFTPAAEQRAPGVYMSMAAELAHRHHLLFVASPALNLTSVLRPATTRRAAAYLELRLAAEAARGADVVNIQAQSLERSTNAYVAFVKQAAAQARRAKPGVTVLAGISSNPTGLEVTGAQLARAMRGVRPYVDGYWMNIPSPGALCPGCNQARPDLAIRAIDSLFR